MDIPFSQMRTDFASLIADWGTACAITRNAGTTDSGGRRTSSWQAVGSSEKLWIQPVGVTDKERQVQGVVEGTSHVAFQSFSGTPLIENDRITAAGDAVPFEVIGIQVFPNHRRSWLKQVKK